MAIVEGRGADGKFTKGNSGGGRLGTGIDKTARALLKENSEKITKKIIELALEGDATLLKALFDRLIPTQSLAQLLLTEQMIRLEEAQNDDTAE
jgi:hypothetical protein